MPERILIIGEIETEVDAYADSLAHDYTLSLAPGIPEAGKRLQKEAFALILFDLCDERTDIAEIIGALQQLSPSTPIVVASQTSDAGQIVAAVRAGAADFITKPFAAEKLRPGGPDVGPRRCVAGRIGTQTGRGRPVGGVTVTHHCGPNQADPE